MSKIVLADLFELSLTREHSAAADQSPVLVSGYRESLEFPFGRNVACFQ